MAGDDYIVRPLPQQGIFFVRPYQSLPNDMHIAYNRVCDAGPTNGSISQSISYVLTHQFLKIWAIQQLLFPVIGKKVTQVPVATVGVPHMASKRCGPNLTP